MNENLDLIKILKDVPAGTKLWSPMCGECEFVGITTEYPSPIRCKKICDDSYWQFRSNGCFAKYDDSECVLFPSKVNRDWSTFKILTKHKKFNSFQKILVKEYYYDKYIWVPELYGFYDTLFNMHHLLGSKLDYDDNDIIPYEGNENLCGTYADC